MVKDSKFILYLHDNVSWSLHVLIHSEVKGVIRNLNAPIPHPIVSFQPESRAETWKTTEIGIDMLEFRTGLC